MNDNDATASAPNDVPDDVVVTLDPETHVATVEIQRGPHNFFDLGMFMRLADRFHELAGGATAGDGARVIVLCSEGKNFCAGADFSGRSGALGNEQEPHLYDVAIRLFDQPLPIVAAVQGAAIGGGLGLALAADFRVGTPESRFAANFSLLGFHQGFGLSETLPHVVGNQAAADLLYTGRRIDGETAGRIGLVDHVVPAVELRSRATALAVEIAAAAPLAVRSIRQTLRGDLTERVRAVLHHERAEQERLQQTNDWREGITAVSERRIARFSGR
ncbi:MAG: enoyl-CoA hydratase/isomerase family protein [Ilumatobacteraceae bacterium]